jgi:hypothetical protein
MAGDRPQIILTTSDADGEHAVAKFVTGSSEHATLPQVEMQTRATKHMKLKYLVILGLVGLAAIGICYNSVAEQAPTKSKKRISPADKAAIKELLKGADQNAYRVQFDGGKDTIGAKKLTLASVKQAGRTGVGTGVFLVDDDIMICWKGTVPWKVFEGQLGKEKVQRLNTIMAKYQ